MSAKKFHSHCAGRRCKNSAADVFLFLLIPLQELCAKLQAGKYPPAYQGLYQGHCSWDMPAPRRRTGRGRSGRSTPAPAMAKIKQWAVIFGDSDLIKNISEESTFYFADATFRCTPRTAWVLSLRASQVIEKSF